MSGISELAPRTGFEPAACRLGGDRSIHLSYRGLFTCMRRICAFRKAFPLPPGRQPLHPLSCRGVYGMIRFSWGLPQPGSQATVRGNECPLCILPVFFRPVNPKDRFCRKICKGPRLTPGLDFFLPACYDRGGGKSSAQSSQKIFSAGAIKRRADAFQL